MTEKEAIQLWKEVLDKEDIDSSKTFFENGGDSLSAMTMLQLAEEKYSYSIDLMNFFEIATIDLLLEDK